MAIPLMPKATAVWLVECTTLNFNQIAEFCGLHQLEVQAIADDEVAIGMVGIDPVTNGQLTREEIARAEADPSASLEMAKSDVPDCIAWLLRNHPELSGGQIGRLIGTTKPTINAIRDRTHWNSPNLRPRSPVELGLCTRIELDTATAKGIKAGRKPAEIVAAPIED